MFARISDSRNPIYSESQGQGEDVMLVHGWGMHGGFFREFQEELARGYRVTRLDLPGHGRSAAIENYAPENIATLLAEAAPKSAHWIGWSLGATLVSYLSEGFPERVKTIGLIAGNPKFSRAPDWPHAISTEVLDQFKCNVCEDFTGAILRFLKIQTFGLEYPMETYRFLKERLHECEAPEPRALSAGVDILKSADRRAQFKKLAKPIRILLGTEDSLVPVEVGEALISLNPAIEVSVIQQAGHIPFITHRERCLAEVRRFLVTHGANPNA